MQVSLNLNDFLSDLHNIEFIVPSILLLLQVEFYPSLFLEIPMRFRG